MNITKTLAICLEIALVFALTACGTARPAATPERTAEAPAAASTPEPGAYVEAGTETERGFVLDNVLHSAEGTYTTTSTPLKAMTGRSPMRSL